MGHVSEDSSKPAKGFLMNPSHPKTHILGATPEQGSSPCLAPKAPPQRPWVSWSKAALLLLPVRNPVPTVPVESRSTDPDSAECQPCSVHARAERQVPAAACGRAPGPKWL